MLRTNILAGIILLAATAQARIARVVVEHREPYKDSPQYEKLAGHAYGELDPKDTLNAVITDLMLAPRNARGMVEYSATFIMAKPVDMAKASGVLAYLVPTRGN